ncbi:MAG: KTSC domain-containing protein [Myxococcales bacterium]|nr:KTSC domain-containing protein [Myxococcales bacterium]MCB9715583.1 KTSC domain-containing protein [Myxococcales bacterium]
MEREPVESSALASIGYDPSERVLEIEFRTGKVYQYLEVPPELHAWLMQVKNKGGVFSRKVDGQFQFRRVDHLDPAAPSLEDALRASLALARKPPDDDEPEP